MPASPEELIQKLYDERYITQERIAIAFRSVPREHFLPAQLQSKAYWDRPLPIGHSQTISAPHMVALLTELLQPQETDQVLEIGTGSGYQAAILAHCVDTVISVERHEPLATQARHHLQQLGIANVTVIVGDGSTGYAEKAPYDKILATAATQSISAAWREQLADSGRIVVPFEENGQQWLYVGHKSKGSMNWARSYAVAFVPLVNDEGE